MKKRWLLMPVIPVICLLMIHHYVVSSTRDQMITMEEAKALKADCILILGAGIWGDRPSPMLEDRLKTGIELYGLTDRLLMSGDHGRTDYDEVRVMKAYAIEAGISKDHIFMDHAGFSTYESLVRAKNIFQVEKVIIISQAYHLPRALFIANQLDMDAIGVSADLRIYAGQDKRDIREGLARIKDFFYVTLKVPPTYLGDTIPITGSGSVTDDLPFEDE